MKPDHAQELEEVDRILKANPGITELALQEFQRYVSADTGREGLSAEQALRMALTQQPGSFTYDELTFHLADSWI